MFGHAHLDPGTTSPETTVDTCWKQAMPTSLDALGASFLQLKQSTRELERITAQLTTMAPAD